VTVTVAVAVAVTEAVAETVAVTVTVALALGLPIAVKVTDAPPLESQRGAAGTPREEGRAHGGCATPQAPEASEGLPGKSRGPGAGAEVGLGVGPPSEGLPLVRRWCTGEGPPRARGGSREGAGNAVVVRT